MPPTKSRDLCHQCRARKVRCSGRPSPCSNCARLEFDCSFSRGLVSSPAAGTAAIVSRRRGQVACEWCRSRKTKCSGGHPCVACGLRRHDCVYPPDPAAAPALSPRLPASPTSTSPTSSTPASSGAMTTAPNHRSLPPVYEQVHLLGEFFLHVYPTPAFSFLHEASTKQHCLEGTLDHALLLALCAFSALFLQYPQFDAACTASWAQQAESAIWSTIERPTIFSIQALIIITYYRIDVGEFQRAFMLTSLVARAAMALRLNYERTDAPPALRELRRRITWAIMLLDLRFSLGLPEYEVCPYDVIYVRLPGKEETRDPAPGTSTGDDGCGGGGHVLDHDGLLETCIRLTTVRRDIMRLKRQVALRGDHPMPQLADLADDIKSSLARIATIRASPYSAETLRACRRSRWVVRYVHAHLSWHQSHCDILRLFLAGYREAAPAAAIESTAPEYVAGARRSCKLHAQSIVEIIRDLAALKEEEGQRWKMTDVEIAICGYHASRLLLFMGGQQQQQQLSDGGGGGGDLAVEALGQAQFVLGALTRWFASSSVASGMLADLEQTIRAHSSSGDEDVGAAATAEDHRLSQPAAAAGLSRAVSDYHKLGVHSLLRMARFDAHHEEGNHQDVGMIPGNTSARTAGARPRKGGNASGVLVAGARGGAGGENAEMMVMATPSPASSLVAMPSGLFTSDTFDFNAWLRGDENFDMMAGVQGLSTQ